jgi:hypothetical protein
LQITTARKLFTAICDNAQLGKCSCTQGEITGMKTLPTSARLLITVAFAFALGAVAQPQVKLEHDASWEKTGRFCTIRIQQIANLGNEDTPELFASIYARRDTGYDGTGSPGFLLARAPIGVIPAQTITQMVVTTRGRSVGSGEKFTALLIETKEGRRYSVADWVVFTSTYTFPRGQNGGVGSEDVGVGIGDVTFEGTNGLTLRGRRASFGVERIRSLRGELAETGPLRLAIYAMPEVSDGSTQPVVIGTRPLGRLTPGDYYLNQQGTMTLRRPGRGMFYLSLVLEEDRGEGYQPLSYLPYPELRKF